MIDIFEGKKKTAISPDKILPSFALRPLAFRTEYATENKIAYHFFREGQGFQEPDQNFFTETGHLAELMMDGLADCAFFADLIVDTGIGPLNFAREIDSGEHLLARNESAADTQEYIFWLENISHQKNISCNSDGFFVDYYAIAQSHARLGTSCREMREQLRGAAKLAIISDDTHAVWTILRDEKYSHNMLLKRLRKFCHFYSADLHWYKN